MIGSFVFFPPLVKLIEEEAFVTTSSTSPSPLNYEGLSNPKVIDVVVNGSTTKVSHTSVLITIDGDDSIISAAMGVD